MFNSREAFSFRNAQAFNLRTPLPFYTLTKSPIHLSFRHVELCSIEGHLLGDSQNSFSAYFDFFCDYINLFSKSHMARNGLVKCYERKKNIASGLLFEFPVV